jgi:hypothetical protein
MVNINTLNTYCRYIRLCYGVMFRKLDPSHQGAQERLHTFVVLVYFCIWKERNNLVFNNSMVQAAQLVSWVMEEGSVWVVAGFRQLLDFIQ